MRALIWVICWVALPAWAKGTPVVVDVASMQPVQATTASTARVVARETVLIPAETAETVRSIRARIGAVEPTGSTTYLFTDGDPELLVIAEGTAQHRAGEEVGLTIPSDRVHLFDPDSGVALG